MTTLKEALFYTALSEVAHLRQTGDDDTWTSCQFKNQWFDINISVNHEDKQIYAVAYLCFEDDKGELEADYSISLDLGITGHFE